MSEKIKKWIVAWLIRKRIGRDYKVEASENRKLEEKPEENIQGGAAW